MSNLQKHELLARITTYDGDVYYIPEINREKFESLIETRMFVNLQGDTIRTKDIKNIRVQNNFGYEDLPSHQRSKVERMIREYRERNNEEPSQGNIKVMMKRVLSGEA